MVPREISVSSACDALEAFLVVPHVHSLGIAFVSKQMEGKKMNNKQIVAQAIYAAVKRRFDFRTSQSIVRKS